MPLYNPLPLHHGRQSSMKNLVRNVLLVVAMADPRDFALVASVSPLKPGTTSERRSDGAQISGSQEFWVSNEDDDDDDDAGIVSFSSNHDLMPLNVFEDGKELAEGDEIVPVLPVHRGLYYSCYNAEDATICGTYTCGYTCSYDCDCTSCSCGKGCSYTCCSTCYKTCYTTCTYNCTICYCAAGTFSSPYGRVKSGVSCTSCPSGQYAPSYGATNCSYCDGGTYSDAGASACSTCPEVRSPLKVRSLSFGSFQPCCIFPLRDTIALTLHRRT